MARPRVFVSSTFYDLKYARTELERFIRDMGYEPVLNEKGSIPYGSKETLERYCYNEIDKVHVLISIIGGRFGTQSRESEDRSISNMELETAIKQNKQVYIFIEAGVYSEYQTYRKNKSNPDIVYSHVDDARVYKFIDEVYSLPTNNQIAPSDSTPFVISYLKDQWAGLFEQFLQQQSQSQVIDMMQRMEVTTATLKDVVELLKNTPSTNQAASQGREKAFDAIILQNHPLFSSLKIRLKIVTEYSSQIRASLMSGSRQPGGELVSRKKNGMTPNTSSMF